MLSSPASSPIHYSPAYVWRTGLAAVCHHVRFSSSPALAKKNFYINQVFSCNQSGYCSVHLVAYFLPDFNQRHSCSTLLFVSFLAGPGQLASLRTTQVSTRNNMKGFLSRYPWGAVPSLGESGGRDNLCLLRTWKRNTTPEKKGQAFRC